MIAQAPPSPNHTVRSDAKTTFTAEPISLNRVAGVLQVALATRRIARCDAHGYWYALTRGA
jgi:hypothetical protein